jgi:hypothetical protein
MEELIQQNARDVIGVLSGFDRLVLRGTLRSLAVTCGMMDYLTRVGVRLKEFGAFVEKKSAELKEASLAEARALGRPIRYLPSAAVSKEQLAEQMARQEGIENGLICVLSSVEPCRTYEIYRDRKKKMIDLKPAWRKCLFLYHYWMDPLFGFMYGRIQTWFPFSVQVGLNGREWLARQMDQAALRYQRADNAFVWIEHLDKAREFVEHQLKTCWPSKLREIACRLNPAHERMLSPYRVDYYWSVYQSEWATDIMFASSQALNRMYGPLTRSAISCFSSEDVMRFLGKDPHWNFQGEVRSSWKRRPEGVRVKHAVKNNSIKMYDKQGTVLRIETTIQDAGDFRVYRPKEGDPHGPRQWRKMRKGVADLYRRAQVSEASNGRYLDALRAIHLDCPLGELVQPICRAVRWKKQRMRALRPWSPQDRLLLETINRGEFILNGFRNSDLVPYLFPDANTAEMQRRCSARMTYRLRLLRAHRLIRKVPHTRRYVLSPRGRQICSAILQCQHIGIKQLMEIAA